MPSTLETAAESLAPSAARTNYFDQADSQNVVARYGNSKIGAESSAALADASSRLANRQQDRLLMDRRKVDWDREDADYREKQDWKAQRGDFLKQMAALNPDADDYLQTRTALYQQLPSNVRDDDAVTAIMAANDRAYDNKVRETDMQLRRDEQQTDALERMKFRYSNDPRLAVLSPEERNSFVAPDGDFDFVGAAQLAAEKARQNKKDDSVEVAQRKEVIRMERRPKDDPARKIAEEHVVDTAAFPNQVDAIRSRKMAEKGKKFDEKKDLKADPGYEDARLYESNKFESELSSARNMSRSAYVDKVSGLSDAAKKKRGEVWDAAQYGAKEEEAPAPASSKSLDAETARSLLKQAGGDKVKARQLAKEQGFTF
jgi:hypothetical protein